MDKSPKSKRRQNVQQDWKERMEIYFPAKRPEPLIDAEANKTYKRISNNAPGSHDMASTSHDILVVDAIADGRIRSPLEA